MTSSYRSEFEDLSKVEHYEKEMFAGNSYASLLWTLERRYLENFLRRAPFPPNEADYLDFACGTGRILAFMESRVAKARGIEISPTMLELAREKVSRAELVQVDITVPNTPVEGQYDLITAFRFFLNAEPDLRAGAMHSLAMRLKDERSRLIFNIQASVPSHKLLSWAGRWLRKPAQQLLPLHNLMSRRQVRRLVTKAGLEVEETFGYDVFSSKALALIPYDKLLALEQKLAGRPGVQRLCGHQIYVVKKRSERSSR